MLSPLLHARCQHLAELKEEELALCIDLLPLPSAKCVGAAQKQTLYLKAGAAG